MNHERDPLFKWKSNVRKRARRRIPLRPCDWCGQPPAPHVVGRHHDWAQGKPGEGAPVIAVLCRKCHAEAEHRLLDYTCEFCGQFVHGKKQHNRLCSARKAALRVRFEAWLAARVPE